MSDRINSSSVSAFRNIDELLNIFSTFVTYIGYGLGGQLVNSPTAQSLELMSHLQFTMNQEVQQIDFKKLRFAYETVKRFLEKETLDNVDSLDTKIVADLGLAGDDNYDLLARFIKKFELDYNGFDYSKHFYSEGELFGSGPALINLLSLSVWIPLKTIELLTLNKLHLPKPGFYRPSRKVLDMTFKDLITWYVEGKYATAAEIKYEIKKGA